MKSKKSMKYGSAEFFSVSAELSEQFYFRNGKQTKEKLL